MLAGTLYQAADASSAPPSVSRKALPLSLELPISAMLPVVKPLPKLMELTPPRSMVYKPLATGLLLRLGAVAMAFNVSVVPTETAPETFCVDPLTLVPGVVPSVV